MSRKMYERRSVDTIRRILSLEHKSLQQVKRLLSLEVKPKSQQTFSTTDFHPYFSIWQYQIFMIKKQMNFYSIGLQMINTR